MTALSATWLLRANKRVSQHVAVAAHAVLPYRKPKRARVFVVCPAGQVALIERHRRGLHYWTVPGGGIEPGESAEEAAMREVREELGLDVELDGRIGHWGPQVFYRAQVDSRSELSLGGPERDRNSFDNSYEPKWVPIGEATTWWLRPPGAAAALVRLQKDLKQRHRRTS